MDEPQLQPVERLSHFASRPRREDQDAASPDPARERRVKALTCTEPLHSLQTNRGRRGWDGFDFYDLGLSAIDDAAKPAREAKIRSIQYSTFVRQVIEETRRDIRRAGWREDVPQRLAEIREHLQDRMRTEERLLAAMQETRDSTGREDLRRQA